MLSRRGFAKWSIAIVASALFMTVPALAGVISFSSAGGATGTIAPDALSFAYNYDTCCGGTVPDFGVPGVDASSLSWPTSDTVIGFQITFDLTEGVSIDPAQITIGNGAGCIGSSFGGTTFCDGSTPWTADLLSSNSIEFDAPAGEYLTSGQYFFVNIFFTGGDPSGTDFTGEWITATPEPGSMLLAGLGFVALAGGALARRLRKNAA